MESNDGDITKGVIPPEAVRPHLVLLGAGASRAACPNGDVNGRSLPVMRDIVQTLDLTADLIGAGLSAPYDDFEAIYSALHDAGKNLAISKLDEAIDSYFSALRLPPEPCLYDHLLLSLREKDALATFNWDPFLCQAWLRCKRLTDQLPHLITLHGNVGMGYCADHEKIIVTLRDQRCPRCGKPTKRSRLLYPVAHKDYTSDPDIVASWSDMRNVMKSAYVFTIFGYSAPASDVEAKAIMVDGWGRAASREYEEIEIIDIVEREKLARNWEEFICDSHYRVTESFYSSTLGRYPRRGCESVWDQTMEMRLWEPYRSPQGLNWDELGQWLQPLLDSEDRVRS